MVGLPKVYQDVCETSKEIIRLKQRHMYNNVLDRLIGITLTDGTVIDSLTNDQVKFFLEDILPLSIDNESSIQIKAIKAIENFIKYLDPVAYQNNTEWPFIKDKIAEDYVNQISRLRDKSDNTNWYKIWCLLLRILDEEVIRSVIIINKFLAIVEQSYKSPNLNVRAQAFICWKILIEIFAKYNELIPAKRVKLISIPFRSSQAKTLYTAENKFIAYWYFLVKLSNNPTNNSENNNCLELHHEITFGPFLQFCFGNNVKTGSSSLKSFPKVREMAVITLIEMLDPNCKEIDSQLQKFGLEKSSEIIISDKIMEKCWKSILRSCYEATLIIVEQCAARKKLLELIWQNLFNRIFQLKNAEVYKECCTIIKLLKQADIDNPDFAMKPNILSIVELFGTHCQFLYKIDANSSSVGQIFDIITSLTDVLLSSSDYYFPQNIFEPIIKNIYDIKKYKNSTKFWDLQKDLIEYLLTADQLNDFTNFQIKLCIWKTLSIILKDYLDEKLFEFRIPSKAEIVNKWIIWPFKKCSWGTDQSITVINKFIDNMFFSVWKKLILSSSNAEGKSNFIAAIAISLKILCDKRDKIPYFEDVLACYIDCFDANFDKSSIPSESLDVIKLVISKIPPKNQSYNKITEKLINFITRLKDNQIIHIFEEIKTITSALVQAEKSKYITKSTFETYKKKLIETLKRDSIDKKYLKDFKNALKAEEFVIIPAVWGLNPDKLTEHQKEKMKQKKNDIPALYNDMSSHSQDTSVIKPWTPNKIVIPRGKEQLVINSPKNIEKDKIEDDNNVIEIQDTDDIEMSFKKPKDVSDTSITSDSKKQINNKNFDPKEDIVINNTSPTTTNESSKSSEEKNSFKFSKEDENLLKAMNINEPDERKKHKILRSLKVLKSDTVEGKNLFSSNRLALNTNKEGIRTRKSNKPIKKVVQKKTKLNGTQESIMKKNKPAKKSLTFENGKENEIEKSEVKESDEGKTKGKVEENSVQSTEVNDVIAKPKEIEKLQTSNSSVNSEDEIIEASQRSESIITRRLRKSFNPNQSNIMPVVLNDGNKKTSDVFKSPLKKLDDEKETKTPSAVENSKGCVGRALRSSSVSPQNNSNEETTGKSVQAKNSVLDSSIGDMSSTHKKKIAEMETQLNTEETFSYLKKSCTNLSSPVSVLPSPAKSRTLRNNTSSNLTPTKEENEKQRENKSESLMKRADKLREKLVAEMDTQPNTEYPEKTLKSKPISEADTELNTEIIIESEILSSEKNVPMTRKTLKMSEVETEDVTESIVFPSQKSPYKLSSHEKQTDNIRITRKNIINIAEAETEPNTEISPILSKKSNLNIVDEEFLRITRSSPKKVPNNSEVKKQLLTATNSDLRLSQKTLTQNEIKSLRASPRKSSVTQNKVSELDTEPMDVDIFNTSQTNQKILPASPSTPKRNENLDQYIEDKCLESPAYSPIKPINLLKKNLNQSIMSSPECRNTDERTTEFLNNTLNISPIPIGVEKITENGIVENEKLFEQIDDLPKESEIVNNEVKKLSPVRKSTKPASLNSPPDRKHTNNTTSPVPKPKHHSNLTGRGAQLINMIRNRNIETKANRFSSSPFRPPSKPEESKNTGESSIYQSPTKRSEIGNIASTPVSGTPQPVRNLLVFSKTLPSPYASPSASILKRKLRKDSFDDFESPANKRKKVSFHDPPVSVTKEYVKHDEEDTASEIRFILQKLAQKRSSTPKNISIKHSLKRKNRVDSMLELAKFNESPIRSNQQNNSENNLEIAEEQPTTTTCSDLIKPSKLGQTSVEMDTLKWNATGTSTLDENQIYEEDENETSLTPSPSIYFSDEDAVLKHVLNKYSFEEIHDKYSEMDKEILSNKLIRTLTKNISTMMVNDSKIKTNVLEMLSEKHPKEFLDHAIQENLSSVVCERLNTNTVIDFICEIFKNNEDSRKMILDKIFNILTIDTFNQQRHEYFLKLLDYERMSSDEIINCLEILTKNRR